MTRGTGLYFTLARFAVAVHRFHLSIFYYGPQRLFHALVTMVTPAPPIFCLVAIVIRQFIGKTILGAKLPSKVDDETQHKDVMSMIKNFVVNFVLRAFPTAVTVYDVWTHLRADMYVVLCGFFVGIAFSHNHMAGHMFGLDVVPASTVDDSTGADLLVEDPGVGGISDEL
jgi:xanthosine utilization system XapX-like protein